MKRGNPIMGYRNYTRYAGDPYWLMAKFGKCCKCGVPVKGKRAFYYPKDKSVFCEKCGESESNYFDGAAQDEDFYNSQYGGY
jgi:hypothetical protein